MEQSGIVVAIRDPFAGDVHSLRVLRAESLSVGRLLRGLARRYEGFAGRDLLARVHGTLLDPGANLAVALGPFVVEGHVEIDVIDASAASGETTIEGPTGATDAADDPRISDACDAANAMLSILQSTPWRFQEKNRRILARVAETRGDFERMGPVLVNWCDDDIAGFDDSERGTLADVLAWFVFAAVVDPRDSVYNAILAVSHLAADLPWDDESFGRAVCDVVRSLREHVHGGEGTAYVQRALERLCASEHLPGDVRRLVEEAHDSLWKPRPETTTGLQVAGGASERSQRHPSDFETGFPRPIRRGPERSQASDDDESEAPAKRDSSGREGPAGKQLTWPSRPRVALLIDLENLVYGLRSEYGDEAVSRLMDFQSLHRFADQFGDVCVVNAYADWKYRVMNQFQRDLYENGVELIHVLGKGRKNAADLRMAVDLTSMVWTKPDIEIFVIVSGDRDFIEILKELRRHGKRIVGVANHYSVNPEFARLFDHFASYADVWKEFSGGVAEDFGPRSRVGSYRPSSHVGREREPDRGPARRARPHSGENPGIDRDDADGKLGESAVEPAPEDFDRVKDALREILAEAEGKPLKGARIKPLLREMISPRFHERHFGASSMTALLRRLSDVVRVVEVEGGGDVLVLPSDADLDGVELDAILGGSTLAAADPTRDLVREAGLKTYRYEVDLEKRREILEAIHAATKECGESFTWEEVYERLGGAASELHFTPTVISKYQAILYQAGLFSFVDGEADPATTLKKRRAKLSPDGEQLDTFVREYEIRILQKIVARASRDLDVNVVMDVLGFAPGSRSAADEEYCQVLLNGARDVDKDPA